MDHMDARVVRRELIQKGACSIWRIIVDYEDFCIRQMLKYLAENTSDVVRFVIGSGENQSFGHGVSTVWSQIKVLMDVREQAIFKLP